MDLVSVARGGTGEENPRPRPCAGAATWLTGDRLHFAYEQRAFVDRGSSRRLMTVRWSALLSEPRPADIRLSQPSRTPQATVHQAPSPIRHEGGVVVGVTDQLHHLDSRSFHIRAGACPPPLSGKEWFRRASCPALHEGGLIQSPSVTGGLGFGLAGEALDVGFGLGVGATAGDVIDLRVAVPLDLPQLTGGRVSSRDDAGRPGGECGGRRCGLDRGFRLGLLRWRFGNSGRGGA